MGLINGGTRAGGLRNLSEIAAIPDSGMFQNPIYQWTARAGVGVSDGSQTNGWDDQLAGISASDAGGPTYRSDQSGFEAIEYDGTDDGHNWASDSQLPTGNSAVSIAALVYIKKSTSEGGIVSWGTANFNGDAISLKIDANSRINTTIAGEDNAANSSPSTGTWITVGGQHDGSNVRTILNGSSDATATASPDIADDNHSIGWRRYNGDAYVDAYIAEVIICDGYESESAYSDYHTDRLG